MIFPIFGEVSSETIGVSVGSVAAFAFIREMVAILLGWWRESKKVKREETDASRQQKREDLDGNLTRMEKLLDRADRELAAKDRQIAAKDRQVAALIGTANKATVKAERAVVWIKHLEGVLRFHKIDDYQAWVDDDDDEAKPDAKPEAETDVGGDGGYP